MSAVSVLCNSIASLPSPLDDLESVSLQCDPQGRPHFRVVIDDEDFVDAFGHGLGGTALLPEHRIAPAKAVTSDSIGAEGRGSMSTMV